MELPLTFKDSSVKVIIELLPAVYSQEIGKWHMGPGTKQNRSCSLARVETKGKVNDHSGILAGESLLEVERVGVRTKKREGKKGMAYLLCSLPAKITREIRCALLLNASISNKTAKEFFTCTDLA